MNRATTSAGVSEERGRGGGERVGAPHPGTALGGADRCEWQAGACLTRSALYRTVVETMRLPASEAGTLAFHGATRRYAQHHCTPIDGGPEGREDSVRAEADDLPAEAPDSGSPRPTLDEIDLAISNVVALGIRSKAPDIKHEYLNARTELLDMIERYGRPNTENV